MDAVQEATKFGSLPFLVQLDILKKLKWADCRIARLTCTDWFALINVIQKFAFTLSDDDIIYHRHLPLSYTRKTIVLTSQFYFYTRMASLKVMYAVKPIPIYSSTRMDLPRAAELALSWGISEENILKLLRYYAAGCKTLILKSRSFSMVVNTARMKADLVLASITKFSFSIEVASGNKTIRQVLQELNHTLALSAFLAATSMPSLKTFVADMRFFDPRCFNMAAGQKFVKNFGIFIENHGKLISSLEFSYVGHLCGEIFQHFAKLPNVIYLTCDTDFSGVEDLREPCPAVRAALWTPFATYKKLESFTFGDSGWDMISVSDQIHDLTIGEDIYNQFATMVLVNNQNTLTTINKLSYSHIRGSLAWIHAHSYPNLTSLQFAVFPLASLFSNELSKGYKFPKLLELIVTMKEMEGDLGDGDGVAFVVDSRNAFIRWIVQVAPTLKYLTLHSEGILDGLDLLPLPLPHVRTLLLGLHQLKYLKLYNWRDRATSEEVYDWLRSQAQIEYRNYGIEEFHHYNCDISIKSQPLTETIVRAH